MVCSIIKLFIYKLIKQMQWPSFGKLQGWYSTTRLNGPGSMVKNVLDVLSISAQLPLMAKQKKNILTDISLLNVIFKMNEYDTLKEAHLHVLKTLSTLFSLYLLRSEIQYSLNSLSQYFLAKRFSLRKKNKRFPVMTKCAHLLWQRWVTVCLSFWSLTTGLHQAIRSTATCT